ncbi:MAG TPA: phage Gp37/Gp68 family protein [Rhizobiaceae bacterium]|nr:phage Gp37/Gp68 family protein [Rhizobiaceae bacterium]
MSDGTAIEWTDATWNPIVGCSIASHGCKICYAMKLAGSRLKNTPERKGLTIDTKAGPVWNGEVRFIDKWLDQPLRWKRPRKIFVCAHGDLFHESVPDAWIDKVFAVMALSPQHTFQVLTKRAKRMREYLTDRLTPFHRIHYDAAADFGRVKWGWIRDRAPKHMAITEYNLYLQVPWPLPNVWLGVSAEDQKHADERVPELLATPAAVRFVSAEPLVGPIDFLRWAPTMRPAKRAGTGEPFLAPQYFMTRCEHCGWFGSSELCQLAQYHDDADVLCPSCKEIFLCDEVDTRLDWIIAGGESGAGARPMHPAWARAIRDQCTAAGVAFFFKLWGEWAPGDWSFDLDDCLHFAPDDKRIRVFPLNSRSVDRMEWSDGERSPEGAGFLRVGKKAAGRLLDGKEHSAFPEAR